MSVTSELYCALREIDVPAANARAVVNAHKAARNKTTVRDAIEHMPAFNNLTEPELRKLRDELLDLMIKHALR